jgi:NAD(P)H-binding
MDPRFDVLCNDGCERKGAATHNVESKRDERRSRAAIVVIDRNNDHLFQPVLNFMFGEKEGSRMVDNGPILVTGAAGQLGAVGRTVTGLLLDRGLPVRAMVRREDDRAAALRAAGAEVVVGDPLEPADVYRVVSRCRGERGSRTRAGV